jgi:hypothetical protein
MRTFIALHEFKSSKCFEFFATWFGSLGQAQEHNLVFQVFIDKIWWNQVGGIFLYEQKYFV